MTSITPTYNTAFPALYSIGSTNNTITKNQNNTHSSVFPPTIHRSLAPPKYPGYLKQTLYGSLVLEQYNFHQRKHVVKLPFHEGKQAKCSTLENKQMEELDLRLPTFWNSKDKAKNVEVGSNGLDLSYIGPGKQEDHAALARSNFPMRPQCGIYYFEMKVISKGDDGYIGIGFCCSTNRLERLPGWDPDSWGYHGDDGHSFAGSGTGKEYGPKFSTGDVIGCGVDFADRSAFYTKNGKLLGNAFANIDLSKPVYPAIGLRTPGEQVTANFGHEPFLFDIAQYIKDQKIKFIDEITKSQSIEISDQDIKESETNSKSVMDQLVLSYLIHHGYTSTARAVVQNAGHVSGQELFLSDTSNDICKTSEKDMEERQVIRSAIIHGKIDEAIQLIDQYYPGVLQEEGRGQDLRLWLKCGRFVEMMREYCEYNKNRRSNNGDVSRSRSSSSGDISMDNTDAKSRSKSNNQPPSLGGRRRVSYAAIAASLSPSNSTETSKNKTNGHENGTSAIDIDDDDPQGTTPVENKHPTTGYVWSRRTSVPGVSANSNLFNADHTPLDGGNSNEAADYLKLVMQYGQNLQEEYRHDTREKTRSSLVEIFSLLAYPDPYCSPVAYLMNISRRDTLATEVNAAILAYQNLPEMPAVERIYRQIILSNKELACEGNGKSALINMESYCSNDTDSKQYIDSDPMIF